MFWKPFNYQGFKYWKCNEREVIQQEGWHICLPGCWGDGLRGKDRTATLKQVNNTYKNFPEGFLHFCTCQTFSVNLNFYFLGGKTGVLNLAFNHFRIQLCVPPRSVSFNSCVGQGGKYCFVSVTHLRKNYEIVKLTHTLPASLGKEECIYLCIPFRKLYLKAILRL